MRDEDILLLTFEYDRDFQNKCKNEAAITPPPPPPGFRVKQFTKVRFFSCLLYFNCFQIFENLFCVGRDIEGRVFKGI